MNIDQHWLTTFQSLEQDNPDFLRQALQHIAKLDPALLQDATKLTAFLLRLIAQLDKLLSQQMSLILHHPRFQELEARWMSLSNLIQVPFNKNRVKVKCLDFSWDQVSSDLNLANGLKHTQLYNKIGNKELNTLGGEPFGLVIIDHHICAEMTDFSEYDDLYTLELLGELGQQCLCPFIMSPEENFFGEEDALWLSDINRVDKVINGPDYQAWNTLREKEASRFIGLTFPMMKLREGYQHHACGFVFNEEFTSEFKRHGLWGYAHYAFAATVVREFNRISWFGFLKSRWNDRLQGAVLNLPATHEQHRWYKPRPKVRLFGGLARFYAEQGFIPLTHSPLTDKYFFMDNRSIWSGSQQADDRVLSLIQTTLICCRVAHYLKVQIREVLGSLMTASECEQFLSKWLGKYVSNVSSGNDETLAKYPLRSAKVKVKEANYSPGEYICEVSLQPQYQFDMFAGQVLLTTELGESQ